MSGSDLREAILNSAILKNAKLKKAIYNNDTKWPDGFNPKKAGAIFTQIEPTERGCDL